MLANVISNSKSSVIKALTFQTGEILMLTNFSLFSLTYSYPVSVGKQTLKIRITMSPFLSSLSMEIMTIQLGFSFVLFCLVFSSDFNISFSLHIQGGGLCALEILSMANLVNYFGKSETVDEVTIYPILIEKGL